MPVSGLKFVPNTVQHIDSVGGGENDEVPTDISFASGSRTDPPPIIGDALNPKTFRAHLAAGGDRSREAWDRFCSLAHDGDPLASALVNRLRGDFPDLTQAFERGLSDKSSIVRAASIERIMWLPHEIAVPPLLRGFAIESDSGLALAYVEALSRHRECAGVEAALVNALDRDDLSLSMRLDLRGAICSGGDMARSFEIFRSRFAKAQARKARSEYLGDIGRLAYLGSEQAAELLAQVVRSSSDKMERLGAITMLKLARRLSLLTAEEIDELEKLYRGE